MRGSIVILLIGLGMVALLYQSFSDKVRQGQEMIERFRQAPHRVRFPSVPINKTPYSDYSVFATDYADVA